MEEGRILAQYSIRSKQAYIFRTNAIREISGGSALITNAWDRLFDVAEKAGVICERSSVPFQGKDAFADGKGMVELFRGGGNETVLFRDEDTFRLVNAVFTKRLLEDCPGMVPLCVGVPVTGDYSADYSRLMQAADRAKRQMPLVAQAAMLPFSLMDRKTFQPVTRKGREGNAERSYSAEAYAKRQARLLTSDDPRAKALDSIVDADDGRSLLAIVHADGNNMGIKIRSFLNGETDYDIAVAKMRSFTKQTEQAFIQGPWKALEADEALSGKVIRRVVADGDDVTFLCDAHDALAFADRYLKAVSAYESGLKDSSGAPIRFSSCAGICVFHAHYPFSMAYSLAEDCCTQAKKPVHRSGKDEAWIDFHYIHSGLAEKLTAIRSRQETGARMARPWKAGEDGGQGIITVKQMQDLADILHSADTPVSRSRIKRIGAAVENDSVRAEGSRFPKAQKELALLYDRHPDVRARLEALFGTEPDALLKAFYDLYEVYDLWFRKAGED